MRPTFDPIFAAKFSAKCFEIISEQTSNGNLSYAIKIKFHRNNGLRNSKFLKNFQFEHCISPSHMTRTRVWTLLSLLSHRPFFGNSFRDSPIWVKLKVKIKWTQCILCHSYSDFQIRIYFQNFYIDSKIWLVQFKFVKSK